MKLSELTKSWDRFFFREGPVDGICLFRILLGIVLLSTFLTDLAGHEEFWGPYGLVSNGTFERVFNGNHLNLFHVLKPTFNSLYLIMALHGLSLICFISGLKTRIATIVLLLTLTSLNQRNIYILNSADILMRILVMLLVFAPAGNKFSLDAILAKRKGRPLAERAPVWTHRLIQIQIAVVYISTVIAKSRGETWLDGSAVYYATRIEAFTRFPVPFILDNIIMLKFATWSAMAIELSLGTLIFIDEFRKPLILLGVLFHLGIEYMMAIPTFEILMIICLMAMFKIDEYPALVKKLKNLEVDIKKKVFSKA